MKNLENYGVQEMNAKEIKETEGGDIIDGCDSCTTLSDNSGAEFIAFIGGLTSLVTGFAGMSIASRVSGIIGWLSY